MFKEKQKYSIRKRRGWKTAGSVLIASVILGASTLNSVASVSANDVASTVNVDLTDFRNSLGNIPSSAISYTVTTTPDTNEYTSQIRVNQAVKSGDTIKIVTTNMSDYLLLNRDFTNVSGENIARVTNVTRIDDRQKIQEEVSAGRLNGTSALVSGHDSTTEEVKQAFEYTITFTAEAEKYNVNVLDWNSKVGTFINGWTIQQYGESNIPTGHASMLPDRVYIQGQLANETVRNHNYVKMGREFTAPTTGLATHSFVIENEKVAGFLSSTSTQFKFVYKTLNLRKDLQDYDHVKDGYLLALKLEEDSDVIFKHNYTVGQVVESTIYYSETINQYVNENNSYFWKPNSETVPTTGKIRWEITKASETELEFKLLDNPDEKTTIRFDYPSAYNLFLKDNTKDESDKSFAIKYNAYENGNNVYTMDTTWLEVDSTAGIVYDASSRFNVKVKFVNEEGTEIRESETIVTNQPSDHWYSYNVSNAPTIDGYEFSKLADNSHGTQGLLGNTDKTIVLEYKNIANTTETEVDEKTTTGTISIMYLHNGEEIKPEDVLVKDEVVANVKTTTVITKNYKGEEVDRQESEEATPTGFRYDATNSPKRLETFVENGKTYKLKGLSPDSAPESGLLEEGINIIVYEYEEVLEIPFKTIYKEDVNKEAGTKTTETPGKNGKKTESGTILENSTDEVIIVGTKPRVVTEPVKYNTKTVFNPELEHGKTRVVTPGQDGTKVTTTTYTLNTETGEVTSNTDVKNNPATDEVVEYGTKVAIVKQYVKDVELEIGTIIEDSRTTTKEPDTVIQEPDGKEVVFPGKETTTIIYKYGAKPTTRELPFNKETVEDPTKPLTYREITTPGEVGIETSTPEFTFAPDGTPIVERMITTITKDPVTEITTVGVGANKTVPFETRYEADPESPVGTRTTVTPGVNGETDVTGKVLTPKTDEVIKVGTKPTTRELPFDRKEVTDPTKPLTYREVTTPGEVGIETTTYTVNPDTGEVTPNVSVTKDPVTEITTVGTGANKTVPFETRYEADPNKPAGEKETVTPGVTGETDVTGKVLKDPVTEVIKVGTKPTTREIPFDRKEVTDPTKPLTYREVTTPGVTGVETTTYTVNPETGEVTPTTNITTEKVDEITTVGTGANKTVPFETKYVADPESPVGTRTTVTPGVNGETDVTGTVLTPKTDEVIKVGTKPTTKEIPFDRKEVKDSTKPDGYREVTTPGVTGIETTTYTVDPNTGEVTPNTVITTPKVDEVITIGTAPIYTEEWIGDDFVGDLDNDADVIVSVDRTEEWIDDPYVTDLPEINNYTIVVNVDGIHVQTSDFDGITYEQFLNHLSATTESFLNDGRKLIHKESLYNGNTVTLNFNSPDEYKEEWIGDPFAGDKDNDADVIVSVDRTEEWIDDPYVTDLPEINNYTIIVNVDGVQIQVSDFDGITYEQFLNHLSAITESFLNDGRNLTYDEAIYNGNTVTLNFSTPKVDEPKVDTPKVDEPKVDTPKVDEPKVDTPKVDEPKVDTPKVDEPKVDTLKVDEPKVDTPKVNTPEEKKTVAKELPNAGDSTSILTSILGFIPLLGAGYISKRKKK